MRIQLREAVVTPCILTPCRKTESRCTRRPHTEARKAQKHCSRVIGHHGRKRKRNKEPCKWLKMLHAQSSVCKVNGSTVRCTDHMHPKRCCCCACFLSFVLRCNRKRRRSNACPNGNRHGVRLSPYCRRRISSLPYASGGHKTTSGCYKTPSQNQH